ncbi:sumo-activating enzyme subunit 1 [Pyrrhoderma noxium]|uniref:Sumo-activating enzyme subunit 1 n=1 Tax=Pyrrhoderma noxium TaxID=2282107 RepID=A0A286UBD9_9AGAM|nr:sumo-activating enzyme subunit 1 [Pyrrhoderma noxium]
MSIPEDISTTNLNIATTTATAAENMVIDETKEKPAPVEITEAEAAMYDRQIRLWGLDAQQRMRNATIMIVRLRGTATEVIKNIVLSGIGKLIIVDDKEVKEEDLGAGFFFRDEDIGKKRVEVAKPRIESLNPLVTIETISSLDPIEPENIEATLKDIDIMCMTDIDTRLMMRVNEACRAQNTLFYAGHTYGLIGFIFCDLIDYEYPAPMPPGQADKDGKKQEMIKLSYCSMRAAQKPSSWDKLTRVQTKELNPAVVFTILAIWEWQRQAGGLLPYNKGQAVELSSIVTGLLTHNKVKTKVISKVPDEFLDAITETAGHEFSPVCAVIGGVLAQDMLKALSRREQPITNLFVFDGNTGKGSICRMNM